jgi:hypothetical protein
MSIKTPAMTVLAGLAAFAFCVSSADAKSMGGHMGMSGHKMMSMGGHDHHDFRRHRGFGLYVVSGFHNCSYLYDRWLVTGNYYWKQRYFACESGY